MLESVACNLCGGTETEQLFGIIENITGAEQQFDIVRCKSCHLAYVNPRPVKDAMGGYYPEDSYYSYSFGNNGSLKRRIRNYVLEEQGGYGHGGKDSVLVCLLGKLLAKLTKNQVLMFAPYKQNGRALDIGCGCGEFLLWLKTHGWAEVCGVEMSKGAAELANRSGLNVFCGDLMDASFQDGYFDLVAINHVLEHLHDPMKALAEIHRILKPGGLLIVGVPNFMSFENKIFGKHQSILKEVPRHLYHFSMETMTAMLDKSGFKIVRTAGKTFFIPSVNKQSIKAVRKHESTAKLLSVLCRAYMERPFRYMFTAKKEAFGQLFTFYAQKNV